MAGRTYVLTATLRRRDVAALAIGLIATAFAFDWVKRMLSRHARERAQEVYRSRQALIRYVQLHHQCLEEVAYQRVAAFVKRYVSGDEWDSLEYMEDYDRQRVLELARRTLLHDAEQI